MGGVPVLLTRGMGERLTCRIRCHKILGPLLEWGPYRDFGAPFELALWRGGK